MKTIKLTQGKVTWISDEDYPRVSKHRWWALKCHGLWYAVSKIDNKLVYLHRFVLNTPDNLDVDHRDGNGLDNRRSNVRNCTTKENLRNQRPMLNKTSRFKGVAFNKRMGKWYARIRVDGKIKYLGSFGNEDDAALAYNVAAKKYFGDFARLNVIVKPGESYSLFA